MGKGADIVINKRSIDPVEPAQNEAENDLKVLLKDLGSVHAIQNEPLQKKTVNLSGKLITAENALVAGDGNFRELTNMRYGSVAPKSIAGMTKINTTPGTYLKTRNAFQFKKPTVSSFESHIMAQRYNTGLTASYVMDCTVSPPTAGEFSTSLWADSTGAGKGIFSGAPNSCVAYCNGVDTCLWGGLEDRIGRFVNFNPDGDFFYDFTDILSNTKTDTNNCAVLVPDDGGIDTYTKLLLHFDNNVTDSSSTGHTVTNNNVTFTTSGAVFSYCAVFNGTTAYLTIPDHADFDLSGGKWTLDFRGYFNSVAAVNPLWYQSLDVKKITFEHGTGDEPALGSIIYGHSSTASGKVLNVDYTGTWGVDATGTIYYSEVSGHLQNSEEIRVTNDTGDKICDVTVAGGEADAGDNLFLISISASGYVHIEIYESYATPAYVVNITCATPIAAGSFYHIEVSENGDSWYIFVNGSLQSLTTDTGRPSNYGSVVTIGKIGSTYLNGKLDEFRLSNGTVRHTSNFTVPISAYSASTKVVHVYIGSIRPLQGWRPYVKRENTAVATCTGFEWTGTAWSALAGLSDATSNAGRTLYNNGYEISFTSTVSTSKQKFIEGVPMYYYWFIFDGIDATTSLYYATINAPFQQIVDYWDGVGRSIGAAFVYETSYTDYTINVFKDEYDSLYPETYMDLGSLPAYSAPYYCVHLGFWEFPTAINLAVPAEGINTTADTILYVDYWNGSSFVTIGTIDDGTSENGISLAKSGTVSWNVPSKSLTYTRTMANNTLPLYYIRLRWSKALSASTKIYYINSVPRQKDLYGYKFPLLSQDRLMLCCDMNGERNKVVVSALDTSQVFNGQDSVTLYFGGPEELTCGTTVFAMYGSSLYNITLFFKEQEMWGLVQTDAGWKRYGIADIGCPAPLSLCTTVVPPVEGQQASNRCFAIWVNSNGVFTSDGRHPINVSYDIRDLFDQNSSTHINLSYINSFSGFVDKEKMEYHLFVALTTGTVTTLDAEYVLDLRTWRWFKIDRGTGNKLQCGISVTDAYGNNYSYGFIDTGYCERLEYGKTFDGTAITSTLQTGDFMLSNDPFMRTSLYSLILVMASKATATEEVSATHYIDSKTSGTSYTIDPTSSGYNLAFPPEIINSTVGLFHSIKLSFSTSVETYGFEPLVMGLRYSNIREQDIES